MNPVQDLYHECAKVAHYNNQNLQAVATVMNRIDLACVGETEDALPRQFCEFVEVANEQGFQVALFKIPAGQRIPLHDHPGMTVFSKVLHGSVAVRSFDKLSNTIPSLGDTVDASIVKNGEIWTAESGVQITLPGKGNLHEMRALEPSCLLDVLTPPYGDFGSESDCSYFEVAQQHGRACTLRRVECPKSFFTLSAPYCGLPVHGDADTTNMNAFDPSFLRAPSEEETLVPWFDHLDRSTNKFHGAERSETKGSNSVNVQFHSEFRLEEHQQQY